MIFTICMPKIGENWRFLYKILIFFKKNLDHNIGKKIAKIAENCDHITSIPDHFSKDFFLSWQTSFEQAHSAVSS
jgi:hypothetical protein